MPDPTAFREQPLRDLLARATRAIVRVQDTQELLNAICGLLLGGVGYEMVRVTQRHERILVTAAEAGAGESPPLFWEKHVLTAGRTVVHDDLGQSHSNFGAWASAALFPLRLGGEIWGCLAIYSTVRQSFPAQQVLLLEELAGDLEIGLQQRRAAARGRDNEQFLLDMANLVPGMFYKLRYDPVAGPDFLYVSPGIDLLLPMSAGQARENAGAVFRSLHPADRRAFHRASVRSRDFLTVFSLEFRLVRPNGSIVWVLATAFPQRVEGAVVWTGLAIDVTPQNKLQDALRREQELLSVVLDNIGDGVVAVDEQGNLALVNRIALGLLDQTAELIGQPWQSLDASLPWDASEQFHPWFRSRSDGSVLHMETYVSSLTDDGHQNRGRVLLLRDMTDRDRVEERLRQSEKLESVGLLAGGIAHDFNNLLTGIFGFIQLARMNADQSERVVTYLDHALGPFQRARTLTQQLLTFAKGGQITKGPVRLEALVPPLLEFAFNNSSITWTWLADESLWPVLANEAQLHQVFENLFVNAKQAMPKGGTLALVARNIPAPGPSGRDLAAQSYVEVAVEDNGPGVAADALAKVFDPFFTTKPGGTGLGLSICFSIVKKHGGLIEVENRVEGGARFRVFLPVVLAKPSET